ncbi:Branched-chain amino acid aminotransferase [Collimonas arenae]|uniref:branched-chain-amino-acid transaminase n=1 Tax=Collimonas arenae TaxID=279058 RepID=A0A0A1F748_9BURK|nr:aminotransferase class IV [Collimonas arenae]AIY39514.1 Branched-chain amino acid aminotransferase [Collimonas arenae]
MSNSRVSDVNTQRVDSPAEEKASFARGAAFVDGKIVPVGDAKISILDWGFLRSDATYDVVHVWNGRFFRLQDHLDRFSRGMKRLRMTIPYSDAEIQSILQECVLAAGLTNAYVEVVCTRGIPLPGSRDPRQCTNKFYAFAVPFTWIATEEQRVRGLRMRISNVHRIAPEAVDPTIKNYHWLDLINSLFEAYNFGDETAVLTDGREHVIEGPGFNIFAVIDGIIVTPRSGVLEGITRQTVIDLAEMGGYELQQRALKVDEFRDATEIFISSTAGGVMPVGWIDGKVVGTGGRGPLTEKIQKHYWELHIDPAFSTPVSQ